MCFLGSKSHGSFLRAWGLPVLLLQAFLICNCAYTAEDTNTAKEAPKYAPSRDYERESMRFKFNKKPNKSLATTANSTTNKTGTDNKISAKGTTSPIVITLIFSALFIGLVLWVVLTGFKKFLPGGKKLFSTPAMEILGRTHFDSQKYLALVRVGQKLVVVGVSPNGFDSVTEVTDKIDVTDIMALAKPTTTTGQNLFHKMFQKTIEDQPGTTQAVPPENISGIDSIQQKIRELRESE